MEHIFLEEMALNKCTIIYMSIYAYKCYTGFVWGLLYSRNTLKDVGKHWEERRASYLGTIVGAIILTPRKG